MKVEFVCEECHLLKDKDVKERNKRFCSRKCMCVWRSREIKNGHINMGEHHSFGKRNLNPNWKGGVTPINDALRRIPKYKLWRKEVLERDNYTCIWCGSKENIQVDHIEPFSLYPKLRYKTSNGRTLCARCHRRIFVFYGNKYKRGIFI